MKCVVSQAIYSETPPNHEITSVAFLSLPLTVWTGGKRGEIFVWNTKATKQNETSSVIPTFG